MLMAGIVTSVAIGGTLVRRNLDIYLLRTFVAVADFGQISKAAKYVHVTQSAASQQVARLERQLGLTLLERRANSVSLSPDGQRLYDDAAKILSLNDSILAGVAKTPARLEVRLGVSHDLVDRMVPTVLKDLSKSHPEVSVRLISLPTDDLLHLFHAGEADIIITTEPKGEGNGTILLDDRLVWVGSQEASVVSVDPLPVALGGKFDRFSGPVIEALEQADINWKQINLKGGLEAVLAVLAADMAIAPFLSCMVPASLAVAMHQRLPALPEYQILLVARPDHKSPELEALSGHIRAFFDTCRVSALN
jgi:DNA-binding transcriptional LysR family regulator